MSENEKLYEKALDAVRELFSDTSVSQEETKIALDSLVDEIEMMKESLAA